MNTSAGFDFCAAAARRARSRSIAPVFRGVLGQHRVVVELVLLRREVVDRRRDKVDLLHPGLPAAVHEIGHALLEGGKPALVERLVDAVVHPVAGEHDLGLRFLQEAVESLGQARAGKLAAGVTLLAQPGQRLARQAEADDVVKWLMLALVAVFDPLAVTLVIAFNMAVQGRRPRAPTEISPASPAAR